MAHVQYSTAQKLVTTLSRDANRVARYAIPVAEDAIVVARWPKNCNYICIMAKILERFQESMVKLYRD